MCIYVAVIFPYNDSWFLCVKATDPHWQSGKINVKHFVSDSNGDTSDIGGKFAEANNKLVAWCDEKNINTSAILEFRNLRDSGHFPGLGVIKKLSIINHIELMVNSI